MWRQCGGGLVFKRKNPSALRFLRQPRGFIQCCRADNSHIRGTFQLNIKVMHERVASRRTAYTGNEAEVPNKGQGNNSQNDERSARHVIMGCCSSRDAATDASAPRLEPQLELEALLAEAVRAGLLDGRSAAETRRRCQTDGEVAEAIGTWREILGLDVADHAAADARERAARRRGARSLRNRVRSRSLVANAQDDLEDSGEDTGSVGSRDSSELLAEEDTIGRTRNVRRLSFLRRLTKGSARFDGVEAGWVDCKVVACGQFGLGVLGEDGTTPLEHAPRLQAGDVVPGLVEDCEGDLLRVRLPDGREGLAPRQRTEEGGRVRVLIAPKAQVPDRHERRSDVDLAQKLATLREACASLAIPWARGHVDVKCARKDVAATALAIAAQRPARDFRKTWRFELTGERGMDAGGLARECWAHVAEGVFSDPERWHLAATDDLALQIRPQTGDASATRRYYRSCGRLVAKALFDGQVLPQCRLARPLLKHILALPVTFEDLEKVDEVLYRSCRAVVDEPHADRLCLTFTFRDRDGGETVALGPDGATRDVTDANKDEYVARLFRHAVLDQVARPLAAFLRGFYDVVPLACLSAAALDASDLELAIAGLDHVDVADWQAHTTYSEGFSSRHDTVATFWIYVEAQPLAKKAKLLQFVTGTSRVPAGSFARLQGRDGTAKPFELRQRPGGDGALPVAHTCFNRLDLPEYSSPEPLAAVFDALLAGGVLGFSGD